MSETTGEILKVSDCHHAGITSHEAITYIKGKKLVKTTYRCNVCKGLCKVVELLVEER